jgi:hypothetical protein
MLSLTEAGTASWVLLLTRVKSYINYRAIKPLFGQSKPSVKYVEVFDIPDLEGFLQEDMGGSVVQSIMGEFMQYVENPEFILAEAVVRVPNSCSYTPHFVDRASPVNPNRRSPRRFHREYARGYRIPGRTAEAVPLFCCHG